MVREIFEVGELVVVDPGYHSGIWLRTQEEVLKSVESSRIPPDSRLLVLKVKGTSVFVVGEGGVVGWTWMNRLKHLE